MSTPEFYKPYYLMQKIDLPQFPHPLVVARYMKRDEAEEKLRWICEKPLSPYEQFYIEHRPLEMDRMPNVKAE